MLAEPCVAKLSASEQRAESVEVWGDGLTARPNARDRSMATSLNHVWG
jgi:hypothetical protein